jgi:hypothetical protein
VLFKTPMRCTSILLLLHLLNPWSAFGCSMFKLTDGRSTVVGCNHDAWVTEPQLKFTTTGYGAAFTGATRYNGRIAPQSGMNEHGLVFTTLSIYPPDNASPFRGKPIADRTLFLESVLQQCKTLEEVEQYFYQYNRSCFLQDLFVYIDTAGRVLFVEPYCMHYSMNPALVQSNFCPSETADRNEIKQERFVRGNAFIAGGYSAELPFARSMIEEMSVCRERHGDGTLISTVWDNQHLCFEVMFYHDFDSVRSFDLRAELLKGDATYPLEQIFPKNRGFEELKSYRTPFNTPALRLLLALIGGLSGILGLWFIIQLFRSAEQKRRVWWTFQATAAFLGLGYCFILATDIAMFYYPWPYMHPQSWWRTALGITPLVLFLAIIINLLNAGRILDERRISLFAGSGFYLLMMAGFFYWTF